MVSGFGLMSMQRLRAGVRMDAAVGGEEEETRQAKEMVAARRRWESLVSCWHSCHLICSKEWTVCTACALIYTCALDNFTLMFRPCLLLWIDRLLIDVLG